MEKMYCWPGNSRDTEITAMCPTDAPCAYRVLFNTIQCTQGEDSSGMKGRQAGPVATQTPAAGAAAAPENQSVQASDTPVQGNKYTKTIREL